MAQVRSEMKRKAASLDDNPTRIFAEGVAATNEEVRANLPSEACVKRGLRRNRAIKYPLQPDTLRDLVIDGCWATTGEDDQKRFLFYDNSPYAGKLKFVHYLILVYVWGILS